MNEFLLSLFLFKNRILKLKLNCYNICLETIRITLCAKVFYVLYIIVRLFSLPEKSIYEKKKQI